MANGISTLIFDFYDVVHEDPQVTFLSKNGLERTGVFAEASDLLDVGKIDYAEYLQRYAHGSGLTIEEVRRQYNEAALDTDMRELLRWLAKSDYKTGLLSNTTSAETRPILERHGLASLFDTVIISAEEGVKKPDPQIFRLALERLGAKPGEAVFIDDNPKNVAAARTVGMNGIHFRGHHALQEQLCSMGILPLEFIADSGQHVLAA